MFYKTLHYCLARYLELMCFKLSQLSNYVCFCCGISVHENNYDTSRRQKRFHTIWSRNTLQIFAVNPVELAKSEDCDFFCIKDAVPLVSYIRNSLRFWHYASLSTCCQNLEKNWGHWENLGESGGQTFNPIQARLFLQFNCPRGGL